MYWALRSKAASSGKHCSLGMARSAAIPHNAQGSSNAVGVVLEKGP